MKELPCIATTLTAAVVGLLGLVGVSVQAAEQANSRCQAAHDESAPTATSDAKSLERGEPNDVGIQSPPGVVGTNWPDPVEDSQWFGFLLVDQFENRMKDGDDTLRWDVVGWYGGDYNRLWVKTEGDWRVTGERGGEAEVQVLYGRLVAPFWDVQVGLRYDQLSDAGFDRGRAFAVIGLEGFAKYRFDVEPALFVSDDGDVSARLAATYELLLTQRLALQPRADFDVAVQSAEQFGIGEGVNSIGLGLRLRYEIMREIAPYIGVQWLRRFGDTADISRRDGGDVQDIALVLGVRLWF